MPALTQPIAVVDAFTHQAFSGNPAGVCLLTEPVGGAWMQHVARELNHAETAFVWPLPGGQADGFSLRWFTPTTEVELCGHATLAAAHRLWQTGQLAAHQPAYFHTLSGLLSAVQVDGWIELDFPVELALETVWPGDLAEILGSIPLWVGVNRLDYLVELSSAAEVRQLTPDLSRFAPLGKRGMIVTAAGDGGGYDMVSRGFFPNLGIPEDAVTGSAHCALAPYWAAKLGRGNLSAYQASARGGELKLRLQGERVKLLGQAVTTLEGLMWR